MNKWLNFGGDPDHRLDTGIVFRIHHYWETRKVVNGHSFILIRQMAALVRRALFEVCTAPSASSTVVHKINLSQIFAVSAIPIHITSTTYSAENTLSAEFC